MKKTQNDVFFSILFKLIVYKLLVFMTIVWKEREDGFLPDETIVNS